MDSREKEETEGVADKKSANPRNGVQNSYENGTGSEGDGGGWMREILPITRERRAQRYLPKGVLRETGPQGGKKQTRKKQDIHRNIKPTRGTRGRKSLSPRCRKSQTNSGVEAGVGKGAGATKK